MRRFMNRGGTMDRWMIELAPAFRQRYGWLCQQPVLVRAEIERQHRLSLKLYAMLRQSFDALGEVREFRGDTRNAARERQAAELEQRLTRLNGALGSLYRIVEETDVGPTSQVVEATGARDRELNEILAQWQALRPRD